MMLRRRSSLGVVLVPLAGAPPARAQRARPPGFAPAGVERWHALESANLARAGTAKLERHVRTLSGWARVAGTLDEIGGRRFVFGARNPGSPALMVYDVTAATRQRPISTIGDRPRECPGPARARRLVAFIGS